MRFSKVGVPQIVIVRAPDLLPMLYTPRELEQEPGVPSRTIREWIRKKNAESERW